MRNAWVVVVVGLAGCKDRPRAEQAVESPVVGTLVPIDAGARITSPLAEAGPHPDYPTPVASGTDKIFLLEEPDRGADVPPTFELPRRAGLVWTGAAACEIGVLQPVCVGKGGPSDYRIAKQGRERTIVDSLVAGTPIETWIYVTAPDGSLRQWIQLDAYGRVTAARTFQGDRYSERAPSGANLLAGCGAMAFTRTTQGHVETLRCLQWSGEPMRDTRGVATTRFERDARGFVTAEHYLGVDGTPVLSVDGYASVRHELDVDGFVLVTRYFDGAGAPVASTEGCHAVRRERDVRHLERTRTCLDAAGRPVANADATAITRRSYDARGCQTSSRRYAADGKPAIDRANVHGMNWDVDERCARLAEACVNVVEQPVACGHARPARFVWARDALGRMTSEKYFGVDGKPTLDNNYRVHEVRYQHDDAGRRLGMSCWTAANGPSDCGTTGFHAQSYAFDGAGRVSEVRYFDTAGAPAKNIGASLERIRYDNYDHEFELTSHDERGELIETLGSATRRNLYDPSHRLFAVVMLDKAGKPAAYSGCYTGVVCPRAPWHAVRIVRRPDGTAEKNLFFDAAGQLMMTSSCRDTQCFE